MGREGASHGTVVPSEKVVMAYREISVIEICEVLRTVRVVVLDNLKEGVLTPDVYESSY